jgi:hypothetical protein
MLIEDRRLNYLYGKVYRSSLLTNIRVEDDVKTGSDTMINCQYIANINNIVLIDDLDYHYIKYNSRSVTSYSGNDIFPRVCRINRFIYKSMEEQGYLTVQMTNVIDKRILLSAIWAIEKYIKSEDSQVDKVKKIDAILNSKDYQRALNRFNNNPWELGFKPIQDKSGEEFFQRLKREEKIVSYKKFVLSFTPKWVHNTYRRIVGRE